MTRRLSQAKFAAVTIAALGMFALTGCAGAAPQPQPSTPAPDAACTEVAVVVDFGALGAPSLDDCVGAGAALDVLDEAGVTTEGTLDYGDQVVCRVNDQPAPETESCATLPSGAYWALWVKPTADAEWEYAQEGVATLELVDGQSVGLVYTEGSDSTPPEG
ncbi:MAG: hypothetical protein ABIQ01_11985 [Pseudolysinimonas sp.]